MPAEYEGSMLGAFVKDYADPAADATVPGLGDGSHVATYEWKTFGGKFSDFVVNNYQEDRRDASAVLESLAGVRFSGETSDAVHLSGKFIRYRRLRDVPAFFAKVRNDEEVKSRVPNWIKLSDVVKRDVSVCLVVGVMICEDVDVEWGTETRTDVGGNIQVPLDKIVLAVGVPNPLGGGTGNPQIGGSTSQRVGSLFKAHSGESRIFALQLRSITKGYIIKNKELIMRSNGPSVDRGRVVEDDERRDDGGIADDDLFPEDSESEESPL